MRRRSVKGRERTRAASRGLAAPYFSEGDGTRTRNHRIDSPATPPPESPTGQDLAPTATSPLQHAYESASDPDLARVIGAWPALPAPIRRAILALVRSRE